MICGARSSSGAACPMKMSRRERSRSATSFRDFRLSPGARISKYASMSRMPRSIKLECQRAPCTKRKSVGPPTARHRSMRQPAHAPPAAIAVIFLHTVRQGSFARFVGWRIPGPATCLAPSQQRMDSRTWNSMPIDQREDGRDADELTDRISQVIRHLRRHHLDGNLSLREVPRKCAALRQ